MQAKSEAATEAHQLQLKITTQRSLERLTAEGKRGLAKKTSTATKEASHLFG